MIGGLFAGLAGSTLALQESLVRLIALTVALFLLSLRRAGERAVRAAERLSTLERAHDAQRRMLDAATRRPDRAELEQRLRDGRF